MTVNLYDLECEAGCTRCTIIKYERWIVSKMGYVQHLWHHRICDSKTLCGKQIHRSGYSTTQRDRICDRCVKIALKGDYDV